MEVDEDKIIDLSYEEKEADLKKDKYTCVFDVNSFTKKLAVG